MILEEEKQYVEPKLAQQMMDAGMTPGLYCWCPWPGVDNNDTYWELLYGNSDNFNGAIDTWNVGEMEHFLSTYVNSSYYFPQRCDQDIYKYGYFCIPSSFVKIASTKDAMNFIECTTIPESMRQVPPVPNREWYAAKEYITTETTCANAYAIACIALLKAIKEAEDAAHTD